MPVNGVALELFAAESCGASIVRNLLRTLSLKEFDTATNILDKALTHPLIRFGFDPDKQDTLIADIRAGLDGSDASFEYQYARLALLALQRLKLEPDISLIDLTMTRAYAAGDSAFAEETATRLLEQDKEHIPAKVLVRCHDIRGRIHSDRGDLDPAAQSFAAGAEVAHAAKLDYEEWDQRTNRVWCLYFSAKNLEALQEIDIAEKVAMKMEQPDALMKTLIDRGNCELALGRLTADQSRFQKAQDAFLACLAVAEANNNLARQSDALGNLGSVFFSQVVSITTLKATAPISPL